jgi:hypothetical protein
MPRKKKATSNLLDPQNTIAMAYIHAAYVLMKSVGAERNISESRADSLAHVQVIARSLILQGIDMVPTLRGVEEGAVLALYTALVEGPPGGCKGDCNKCVNGPKEEKKKVTPAVNKGMN